MGKKSFASALLLISLVSLPVLASGQETGKQERRKVKKEMTEIADTFSVSYLDSLDIRKKNIINDYSMLGLQYGVGLSQVMWNPSMRQTFLFVPYNIGIMYTRYGKMFGYMPYFGFQAGIIYTQEGYKFESDDDGYTPDVEGAYQAVMDVIEIPFMAHCHFDFWKMKVIADIGFFGGYRLTAAALM